MAVYHHIAGKRELLALVTARTLGTLIVPDEGARVGDPGAAMGHAVLGPRRRAS